MILSLVPIGALDALLLRTLAADLDATFRAQVHVAEALPHDSAWGSATAPIPSSAIIRALLPAEASGAEAASDWVLAIVDAGLCAGGVGDVFGEAALDHGVAVVGLAPLREGSGADADVLRVRLLTEAVHELGHLAGADHCRRESCVMYLSLDIADTDRKGARFCADCRRLVKAVLAQKS